MSRRTKKKERLPVLLEWRGVVLFLRNALKECKGLPINVLGALTHRYGVSYRYILFDYGGCPMWSLDSAAVVSFGGFVAQAGRFSQTNIIFLS
jgi:hypothetical protein